jgi:hypothetical protein
VRSPGTAAAFGHLRHEGRARVLDGLTVDRRPATVLGGQDGVVVIDGFEAIAQLDARARKNVIERGETRLSCTGFDPGDDRLGHACPLCKLALRQPGPFPGESHKISGGAAVDGMLPL